jgi:hypothetical protein
MARFERLSSREPAGELASSAGRGLGTAAIRLVVIRPTRGVCFFDTTISANDQLSSGGGSLSRRSPRNPDRGRRLL